MLSLHQWTTTCPHVPAAEQQEALRAPIVEQSLATAIASARSMSSVTDASLAISIASNTAALAAETSRATGVEASLSGSVAREDSKAAAAVTSELSRASTVEGSLGTALGQETSRASTAESSIAASVAREVSRASTVEASISASNSAALGQETSRAMGMESSIAASVGREVSRASVAEGSLGQSIAAVSSTLTVQTSRAITVEGSIATADASLAANVSLLSSAFGRLSTYGQLLNPGYSCWDIWTQNPSSRGVSGVYYIMTGPIYCEMTNLYGSPGWGLIALLSDNSIDTTWAYSSPLWTSSANVINPTLADPTQNINMKNEAFNSLPLTAIRFIFGQPSSSNTGFGVTLPSATTSAANLFSGGTISTSILRSDVNTVISNIWGASALSLFNAVSCRSVSLCVI